MKMRFFQAAILASSLTSWVHYAEASVEDKDPVKQPSLEQLGSVIDHISDNGRNPSETSTLLKNILDHGKQALTDAFSAAFKQAQELFGKNFDPELYYSYGRSPPVYPTPQGSGLGNWSQSYEQARAMVSKMTLQEKNSLVYGQLQNKGCSGFIGDVPRLGFPGICLNDAESGIRNGEQINGYPAQLHIGASWNRQLAYQRAHHLGREFKTKGINVILGPVIGPLGRIPKGGRYWEGFTNDPYLAGSLVSPTVTGLQESVIACAKHFIANEQESNRLPFLTGFLGHFNQSVSSNLDDRTMHELYMWPFYDAVKAGLGSVMCSYQRVNNSYACQNSKALNGLLKTELGFEGFVVSDWFAQRTGISSANAGMDVAMPFSLYWELDTLASAVTNGSVDASRLDDMVTRTLAPWFRYAKFDTPGLNPHAKTDARDSAAEPVLRQAAAEGHVLVKNDRNSLPLKRPGVLSIFGYDAPGGLNTSKPDSTLHQYGLANTETRPDGTKFSGVDMLLIFAEAVPPASAKVPDIALNGTLLTGGGSGAITPSSSVAPLDALRQQAAIENTQLHVDTASVRPSVNSASDACLVFINAVATESADRTSLSDDYSDELVLHVASNCNNTVVVIHNAGVRIVDRWIEHPNVTAVIFGHLPGQASGDGLVEILYGHQSPSGRLPYTVARSESDYGNLLDPTFPDSNSDPESMFYSQSNFTEGVYVDYKHFINADIAPRFEFGYGLTYSDFSYSDLKIQLEQNVDNTTSSTSTSSSIPSLPPGAQDPTDATQQQPASEGGLPSLYDTIATVSVTVMNTGNVYPAAEVAQLYLGIPNSGLPKVLRGFDKKLIQPGKEASYSFPLRRRDLSIWDVVKQQWVLQHDEYQVMVGKSVLDIQLQGTFTL